MAEMRVLVGATRYGDSCSFYGTLLGFPVHEEWDDPDGRGMLFDTGAGLIEVVEDSPDHPALPPQGVSVALEVEDAVALHERLGRAGLAFTEPIGDRPWGHRSFSLTDPSGLALTFFEVLGR